jgi:putative radical SAM enzyme (TIGR03279 family)
VEYNSPVGEAPGWKLEPLKLRSCHCNCIFCFIDQLPETLRKPLYLKDEDYRFSFLFGNYLTLAGMNSRDYQRIFDLRLSPLYVSIHAVDPEIRGKLLGIGKAPVLPSLKRLIDGGITVHGQIVLVPGANDGNVLQQSLDELLVFCPGLASLSVVPVGLTRHRKDLPEIRLVSTEEAQKTLEIIRAVQNKALKSHQIRWVYPADELLISAGESIPPDDYYDDYPQIENGVGLIRLLEESADACLKHPPVLQEKVKMVWVTGVSAAPYLKRLAGKFAECINGLKIDVVTARNHLMGESVNVAGLLAGEDIYKSIQDYSARTSEQADVFILPPDCLNADGLFLDDWNVMELEERLKTAVRVFDWQWSELFAGEYA